MSIPEDTRVADFIARNKVFASNHTPQPLIDGPGGLREYPAPHAMVVIVSCIDVRVLREAFFGLKYGEAAVVSNAGGRVTADALQSIMVLDSFVGVGTVIVVHHTDCGMSHVTEEMLKQKFKEQTGPEHEKEVDAMNFRTIGDMKQSIVEDMDILRASPYLKKNLKVVGFLFDIVKGTITDVGDL